ncbi:MAG: hypothetical protein RL143_471, partial [Pseudomonadota bacterium]
ESWQLLKPFMLGFYEDVTAHIEERHVHGRIKQWLQMLSWHYPQAKILFDEIRTERNAQRVGDVLKRRLI